MRRCGFVGTRQAPAPARAAAHDRERRKQLLDQGMTWAALTRLIAASYGLELDDLEVDWVLWEHTWFPLAPPHVIARQLDRHFDVVVNGPQPELAP